jgi:hypothetical protein
MRHGAHAEQRDAFDLQRRPEPQLHPASPGQLRQQPSVPADVRVYWVGGTANDVDSGGTDGYNWSYYGLRRLSDNAGGQGTADGTAVILWSCNGGSNQQWSLRS